MSWRCSCSSGLARAAVGSPTAAEDEPGHSMRRAHLCQHEHDKNSWIVMAFDGRLLSGVGVLAAVVEAGSFVRAGEALGLTQSGVSRAVARLEQRIGVRLFDRTSRAVTLTDEGRRFYEQVAPLLTGIEDAASA